MTVYLDVNNSANVPADTKIQLMPFVIEHNDEANVDKYFNSSLENEDGILVGSFRGRPLQGNVQSVPEGYTGVVMKENHKPFNEDEERTFKAAHTFKEFTYWNLDKLPGLNDKVSKLPEWFEIAKHIHGSHSADEDRSPTKSDTSS
ncbi:unnamed protein product [Owenia fusiformis]|uniref:Uncharacterized protein n=1 Tax=Owenia fusiformis TaxID=6347 RepID=A0A8J1ULN5_OWEFU|nr:unnamed protein product [Owenia fusiformis]